MRRCIEGFGLVERPAVPGQNFELLRRGGVPRQKRCGSNRAVSPACPGSGRCQSVDRRRRPIRIAKNPSVHLSRRGRQRVRSNRAASDSMVGSRSVIWSATLGWSCSTRKRTCCPAQVRRAIGFNRCRANFHPQPSRRPTLQDEGVKFLSEFQRRRRAGCPCWETRLRGTARCGQGISCPWTSGAETDLGTSILTVAIIGTLG